MKKIIMSLMCIAMILSLTACGSKDSGSKVSTDNLKESVEKVSSSDLVIEKNDDIDKLGDKVEKYIENELVKLKEDYGKIKKDIDTYDKFIKNIENFEKFYERIVLTNKNLFISLRKFSVDYANLIVNFDKSNKKKIKDLKTLHDDIYEDARKLIYRGIYDGLLDDINNDYYSEILDDKPENIKYEEWSDIKSDEYRRWSDCKQKVYEEWSDCGQDIYEFYSDLNSELYDNDIERAKKKIDKFKKSIDKLGNKVSEEKVSNAEKTNELKEVKEQKVAEDENVNKIVQTNSDKNLIDGLRPEFKEAMDAYEAFYDEYVKIIKAYKENSADLEILQKYTDFLQKTEEVGKKFEAWESEDMNDKEIAYYLEVSSRVLEKIGGIE